MKSLTYAHELLRPLVSVVSGWVYRAVAGLLKVPLRERRPRFNTRVLLTALAVVLTLVIEAVMLVMLAELVDLSISLMELWAELAAKHLEITLDRSS
jgi:hypothetical protein